MSALISRIRAEVNTLADIQGKGIDWGIRTVVIGLRANGVNTVESCQGHRGDLYRTEPFVWTAAKNFNELALQHSREATRRRPNIEKIIELGEILEKGRLETRQTLEPLIQEFNIGKLVFDQVSVRKVLVGADAVTANPPELAGTDSDMILKMKQATMRNFGKFLIRRAEVLELS